MTVAGSLFGLAYGDALGAPTEFRTVPEILARYGPAGPRDLAGPVSLVTDDTQMAIAVGNALLGGEVSPALLEPRLRAEFLAWWQSPENDRAPGNTCLAACANLSRGGPWQQATVIGSKGCGANMRVTPVGLVPGLSAEQRSGAAQLQAALTHGHPTALAASELTAHAVRLLLDGTPPADLPAALHSHVYAQRSVYHHDWLGDLWQQPAMTSPADFIARGWDECEAVLARLDAALAAPDRATDPCLQTGAGWIAEEALVTGLLCFLLFPDDPVSALSRAATTSGDSDSIACLTGAFAGAVLGMAAWPAEWLEVIEYRPDLTRLADAWS
ncbi:ADP-ribosylglycohydrolase family protein [Hamadaea tsunoensis]|uniref:ADP-ribosylglycohydrolase family protein n=1 Tax=Hamadaea tsunoensis TaxID=53368 RepID=UPI00042939EC|nr:ADP-ribosylglycohydrolase family protein [Hamadaea tsunoensis]